ncbi:MAG: AarF/ABC1/UbiB kinase family protein [Planctomycetes bacterium]|nr:AarF/ABC1/UbiB kinase family protein [Planctomycetota bacterium]
MPIRKIGIVSRTYRHINRYRQILTVLIKYGFDDLVDRLRIGHYLEIGLDLLTRKNHERVDRLTTPERIRKIAEELGPTFIKLGQVLSTRPDLIPADLVDELVKLQQDVPPFPFKQVREIVESQLERPLEEVFEQFEEQSLAAGSIGQVHRARLRNGDEVVVKVKRPRIDEIVEVDLEILLDLATLLEKHVEEARIHRPTRIVEEFTRVIERELDFTTEAAHLERFAALFQSDRTLYVPKVYHDTTGPRVLTMEYVPGTPAGDVEALQAAGLDPKRIAARGAQLVLKQVFVHGFFHADPHPGNVFVLPGEVICLLDFGMVGRIDRRGREHFADLLLAFSARDALRVTGALARLTERDEDVELDHERLERDVAEFIDIHLVTELGRLGMGKLLRGILDLLSRHRLRIPAEMVSMLRTLATVEALAVRLDPKLDMIAATEPYVRRLKFDRLKPTRVWRDVVDSGSELLHLAREIPGGLRDLMGQAKRGKLKIGFEHRGLESLIDTNERIANRVSFAIVCAALIVGSSLIVLSGIPPLWGEMPIIGVAGFVTAGVMGFLLLLSIIRHGRM